MFLTRNILFWTNIVQKINIVSLAEIRYLDQLKYEGFDGDVYFFCFWLEVSFLRANLVEKIKIVEAEI